MTPRATLIEGRRGTREKKEDLVSLMQPAYGEKGPAIKKGSQPVGQSANGHQAKRQKETLFFKR